MKNILLNTRTWLAAVAALAVGGSLALAEDVIVPWKVIGKSDPIKWSELLGVSNAEAADGKKVQAAAVATSKTKLKVVTLGDVRSVRAARLGEKLIVLVEVMAPTGGYTDVELAVDIVINPKGTPDKIWGMEVLAKKPGGIVTQVLTPVTVWAVFDHVPAWFEGLRVRGKAPIEISKDEIPEIGS